MVIRTSIIWAGAVAGLCLIAVVLFPVTSRTKPTEAQQELSRDRRAAKNSALEEAWKPVGAAMASGDVAAVRDQLKRYESSGHPLGDVSLGAAAEFYIDHGALRDAREALDRIVHRRLMGSWGGRPTSFPNVYDPKYCVLWLKVHPQASEADRASVVNAWYQTYTKTYTRGGLQGVSPEAFLEYMTGQELMGSHLTRREAVGHYERAAALAPRSLEISEALMVALRLIGDKAGAKREAIRAAKFVDNPMTRGAVLRSGGAIEQDMKSASPNP